MTKAKSKTRRTKAATHSEMLDRYIGKRGTAKREQFELEVELARVGGAIRHLRKRQKLTQEELGEMIGVQKAQISRLESNATNVTFGTILRVFSALKAEISFNIKL